MAKILVVEDNDMVQDVLMRRLEFIGHTVVIAPDGQQALETVAQDRPDIILLDMSMPTMSGWETARRLKGDQATQDIPIIAVTAHAMPSEKRRTLEAGCDEYESKPIRFKRLVSKIERLLPAGI